MGRGPGRPLTGTSLADRRRLLLLDLEPWALGLSGRHLLLDGCWQSAHVVDTGTHRGTFLNVPATGRGVITIDAEKIADVWVTADTCAWLKRRKAKRQAKADRTGDTREKKGDRPESTYDPQDVANRAARGGAIGTG